MHLLILESSDIKIEPSREPFKQWLVLLLFWPVRLTRIKLLQQTEYTFFYYYLLDVNGNKTNRFQKCIIIMRHDEALNNNLLLTLMSINLRILTNDRIGFVHFDFYRFFAAFDIFTTLFQTSILNFPEWCVCLCLLGREILMWISSQKLKKKKETLIAYEHALNFVTIIIIWWYFFLFS